jgi:manganese efflux pump family protein
MMNPLYTVGIAGALAMDACAVAIATSVMLSRVNTRQVFRFAFHFGLFQALMPVLGWFAGQSVSGLIRHWDHWVAFALLCFIGIKAIYQALVEKDDQRANVDPTRGLSLIMLSIATSIDALAVGLSFAMLGVSVWLPCAVIGIITGVLTAICMLLGSRIGSRFGRRMEIAGGLVLIAIGVKIVIEHLLAG